MRWSGSWWPNSSTAPRVCLPGTPITALKVRYPGDMSLDFVYLASGSPRRRELLQQIGVSFRAVGTAVDEAVHSAETAPTYVLRLAAAKAEAGWVRSRDGKHVPVLAADTAVVLDGRILGKPADGQDAEHMLGQLSGRTHEVLTAVALRTVDGLQSRISRRGLISNIYKGRVSRVLPGMQAAFIDIGMERTAFLHASDIFDPRHAALGLEPPRTENIRSLVAEGNEILVQVVKDPLGTKGARLTTYITLPSRYLVYMPKGHGVGVSARIENENERERLRAAVQAGIEPGENAGYIVRTAAEDAPAEALRT